MRMILVVSLNRTLYFLFVTMLISVTMLLSILIWQNYWNIISLVICKMNQFLFGMSKLWMNRGSKVISCKPKSKLPKSLKIKKANVVNQFLYYLTLIFPIYNDNICSQVWVIKRNILGIVKLDPLNNLFRD